MAVNITFNGRSMPSYMRVKAVNFTALPELQHNMTQKTSGVGLIDNGTQILGKTVSVDFILIKGKKTLLELQRDFSQWLTGNNFKLSPLVITDGITVTYQAKVNNSVDITDAYATGEGTIEFMIPTGVADVGNSDVSVIGNLITVFYTGSAITYPVVTVDVSAPCSMLGIYDQQYGRNVVVYGSFRAGDTVVFDCRNKRVKINGYISMKGVSLDSTWLSYPTAGTYQIECTGEGVWSCTVPLRFY